MYLSALRKDVSIHFSSQCSSVLFRKTLSSASPSENVLPDAVTSS